MDRPAGLTDERPAGLNKPQPAGLSKSQPVGWTAEWPVNLTDEQSADSQRWRRSRRTPTLTFSGLGRNDERRLTCLGEQHGKQKKLKTDKTNKEKGCRLLFGPVLCHDKHTRNST